MYTTGWALGAETGVPTFITPGSATVSFITTTSRFADHYIIHCDFIISV